MSPLELAIDVLLALGVVAELVCCLGLVLARTVYDRLHYAGAAGTVGPVPIAAALVAREALSGPGIKTLLTVAFLIASGSVLTSATARTARLREHGHTEPLPGERP